jgi:polysaccharide export outer membrane protein
MKYLLGGFVRGILLVFCILQVPFVGLAGEHKAGSERKPVTQHEAYVIGAGDILEIMVWKNDELKKIVPVRPDGNISLPLVGELIVEGKTIKDLSEQLQETYAKYITDPVISVSVQQINSMYVYIIGRVNAPGVKPITAKTNVLQGLAMASGLTPFAEGNEIQVFRTKDDGTTSLIAFDYDEVSRGRNLQQNIFLKRGDVIVVP